MAISAFEANGMQANLVHCPNPACDRSFSCDACLHVHLRRRYNQSYADAFGRTDVEMLDFCSEHKGCSPSVLGL